VKPRKNKTNIDAIGQISPKKGAEIEEGSTKKGNKIRAIMKKRSVELNIMKIDLNFNPKSPIIVFTKG